MELLISTVVALCVTLAATPGVRAAAHASGRVARPTADRWHQRPTALFGGVGMFVGFVAGAGVFFLILGRGSHSAEPLSLAIAGIVVAAVVMFATGLVDDLRKLRPTSKLVLQGLAGVVLVTAGVHYSLTPWSPVNVLFTLFWFIALTNALNLLDNMDGVTTGITGVSALFFAGLFALAGEWLFVALALSLAGSAFGFLPYNMRPASIFMGDAGSLFHGAMLAGLGAAYTMVGPTGYGAVALVPMLIVIVPILDTGLVTLTRTLAGHPITQGGRDHIAHRLVRMGIGEARAALLLSLIAAGGGLCAFLIAQRPGPVSTWLGAFYVLALVVCGAYLSQLHTYPAEAARSSQRGRVVLEELLYRRRLLEVLLDLVVFAIAYAGAFLLRHDGVLPSGDAALLERTLALAVGCKSVMFLVTGVYRSSWSQASLADLHRLARGTLAGSCLTFVAINLAFAGSALSLSIIILDAMLVALLVVGLRASFRSLEVVRYSLNRAGARTLIYGAGKAGEAVLRELFSNPGPRLHPVGFVDDEPTKQGRAIHGLPVVGTGDDLMVEIGRHRVEKLIISTETLSSQRRRHVFEVCRRANVGVLRLQLDIIPALPPGELAAKRTARTGVAPHGALSLEASGSRH